MPDKPKTPHRTVRIDDDLWKEASDVAAEHGETASDAVRWGLRAYIRDRRRKAARRRDPTA